MLFKMFNMRPTLNSNRSEIRALSVLTSLGIHLEDDRTTRLMLMSSLFLFAVALILLPAYYLDVRVLDHAPIWAKPIKFSFALAIHFLTLAILVQQLERSRRTAALLTFFAYLAVASMLFEQIYISIQAARGQRSHFNVETSFDALMYSFMGIGAVNIVLVSLVLGLLIWRYGKTDNPGLRLGSILGLVIGSVLTVIYGMAMGNAPAQSHLVGEVVNNATIPVVGWSREVGDLRIPHFIATHLMQILPLLGLLSDRSKISLKFTVGLSTVVLVVMSAVVFDFALAGKSVFPV